MSITKLSFESRSQKVSDFQADISALKLTLISTLEMHLHARNDFYGIVTRITQFAGISRPREVSSPSGSITGSRVYCMASHLLLRG